MIEKKYVELINMEIDGANSPDDSEKLKAYLAKNPEARNLYKELIKTSRLLDKAGDIEPPANMKTNILNSLTSKRYQVTGKRNFLKGLFSNAGLKFELKHAYFFTAGLVIGMILLLLLNDNQSLENSQLFGTFVQNEKSEKFKTAADIKINMDGLNGTITIKYLNNILMAEIKIDSEQEISMVFEFVDKDLSFNSFKQMNNVNNNVDIDEKYLKFINNGSNQYIILFNDKTKFLTPVNLKIFSGSTVIYEKNVSLKDRNN